MALDITPLVDVVFLLLIFLLITTTFRKHEQSFPITLPTSSVEQLTVTTDKTTIFITGDGKLHLLLVSADSDAAAETSGLGEALAVTEEELAAELAALKRRRPDAPIAIRGEKTASYQRMIDVVALLEEVGFRNIWFPYEREVDAPPPREGGPGNLK